MENCWVEKFWMDKKTGLLLQYGIYASNGGGKDSLYDNFCVSFRYEVLVEGKLISA